MLSKTSWTRAHPFHSPTKLRYNSTDGNENDWMLCLGFQNFKSRRRYSVCRAQLLVLLDRDTQTLFEEEMALDIRITGPRFLVELLSLNRGDVYFALGDLYSISNVPDPRRSSISTDFKPQKVGYEFFTAFLLTSWQIGRVLAVILSILSRFMQNLHAKPPSLYPVSAHICLRPDSS